MRKIIVTAAVCGSRPTKEMNPAVPYSPSEIASAAVECHRAGASIAHIHVRDPESGRPDFKTELFQEVKDRIQRECDMLVNLTTSGLMLSGPEVIEQRLQPVALKPELCSLDIGSINFQDRVFMNPPEWGAAAAKRMRASGVKPEIEVFDVGHVYQAIDLINQGLVDAPPYFQLCLGVKWGLAGTPENLIYLKNLLPREAVWSVLGVGRAQLPMITLGILLGGHIRVGFEDNLYIRKGTLAVSNAQLVENAVNLIQDLQCEVATPEDARKILGLD